MKNEIFIDENGHVCEDCEHFDDWNGVCKKGVMDEWSSHHTVHNCPKFKKSLFLIQIEKELGEK